jgi:hypothetical protein
MKKIVVILIVAFALTACMDNSPKADSWKQPSTLEIVGINSVGIAGTESLAEYTVLINTDSRFSKVIAEKNRWHMGDRLILVEESKFSLLMNAYIKAQEGHQDEK